MATNRIISISWNVVIGRLSKHDFECCFGIVYNSNDYRKFLIVYEELKNQIDSI